MLVVPLFLFLVYGLHIIVIIVFIFYHLRFTKLNLNESTYISLVINKCGLMKKRKRAKSSWKRYYKKMIKLYEALKNIETNTMIASD